MAVVSEIRSRPEICSSATMFATVCSCASEDHPLSRVTVRGMGGVLLLWIIRLLYWPPKSSGRGGH